MFSIGAEANEELLKALQSSNHEVVIFLLQNPTANHVDLDYDPAIRILIKEQGFAKYLEDQNSHTSNGGILSSFGDLLGSTYQSLFGNPPSNTNNDPSEVEISSQNLDTSSEDDSSDVVIELVHFDPDIERIWRLLETDLDSLSYDARPEILCLLDVQTQSLTMSERHYGIKRHLGWVSYLAAIGCGSIYPFVVAGVGSQSPGVLAGGVFVVTVASCAGQFLFAKFTSDFEQLRNEKQDARTLLKERLQDLGRALFRLYVSNLQLIAPLLQAPQLHVSHELSPGQLDELLRRQNAVDLPWDHLCFQHLSIAIVKIERLMKILSPIFPDGTLANSSLEQIGRILNSNDLYARNLFFSLIFFQTSSKPLLDRQRRAAILHNLIHHLRISDERLLISLRNL